MTNAVLDAHFHLLQPDVDYPWMVTEEVRSLRTYTPSELEAEFSNNAVAGGVVVQGVGGVQETVSLLKLADHSPTIFGVVGWLDLTSPHVDEDLWRLLESPGGDRLVGLRHQVHDEPDPSWLRRPDVMRSLERVAEVDLTFDLLITQREIPAARDLAISIPQLKFVVDHLATPIPDIAMLDQWHEDLASLAARPNTYCKLSGLVTEFLPLGSWTEEQLEPFLLAALQVFGPERCMFGSDWPVCRLAATYTQVVELARHFLSSLSASDQSAVLSGNAVEVYNLNVRKLVVEGT